MPRIEANAPLITLINLFTVEPDRQAELAGLVDEATDRMQELPGFISTSIHSSMDGTRVVNYAQWESRRHLAAMFTDPQALEYLRAISEIASSSDPHAYQVSSVRE